MTSLVCWSLRSIQVLSVPIQSMFIRLGIFVIFVKGGGGGKEEGYRILYE